MAEVNESRWSGLANSASGMMSAVAGWTRDAALRLADRRPILLAVGLLLLVLVVTGELEFATAALAALVSAAVAGFWSAGKHAAEERGAPFSLHGAVGALGRAEGDDGWRMIIDALPDAAVALNAQGEVMHHNALFAQTFAPIGKGRALSSVLRHPELIEAIDRPDASREPVVIEFVERVPLERRISAAISRLAVPPRSRRGAEPPQLLITFRDLSEQDKLSQMRADFVANASHELRTPLASLKGFVETLQGPARDDAAARQRFLTLMASQADRMSRLVDDLLSLSRVEMGVHVPPRGIVDLNEVAAYVVQTLQPVVDANLATVSVEPMARPARIRGDRDQILQVVQNLLQNALSYGRENGKVKIRVADEAPRPTGPARVTLSVIDDGPGIAPEHLPRLTERFYRANVASSRAKGGTGLGLAIVKHIVLRHRGELSIASRLGEGSTFTVAFDELR